ncbi:Lrp/AsnC family transcriptional regulator [Salinirussus salinus]|uniref:Lrp/AsnC family transcriptional regulator n=1 Tax=Salinirussus salinus TaxID=1198300 RepID=UPI0013570C4D|nr:Lrp/AsnC family transcriptional regulator [Salinirussus salinus]
MDVDDIDRQVLAALIADGRAADADLGAAAGVGASTASWRRQSLEDAGVIREYQPRLDYAALGQPVTALFQVDVDPSVRETVLAALRDDARFYTVYEVAGPDDILAFGRFPDRDSLVRARRRLRGEEGVRHVRITPVRPVADLDQFAPEAGDEDGDG